MYTSNKTTAVELLNMLFEPEEQITLLWAWMIEGLFAYYPNPLVERY